MEQFNQLFSLQNKVALISGGHQGLGAEIALALALAGADIVIFDKQSLSSTIKQDITSLGRKCFYVEVDVSNEDRVKESFNECLSYIDGINILVNNAGISNSTALKDDSNGWREIINTNLFGTYFLIKHVVSNMIARKIQGSIINVASINGYRPVYMGSSYCVSKAGIIHLTKALVSELSKYSIRINAIAPGYMLTERIQKRVVDYRPQLEKIIPMKRLGEVHEIVGAALFLASNNASSYVTGSVISVDGGLGANEIAI